MKSLKPRLEGPECKEHQGRTVVVKAKFLQEFGNKWKLRWRSEMLGSRSAERSATACLTPEKGLLFRIWDIWPQISQDLYGKQCGLPSVEVRNSSDLRGTFGIEWILLKRTHVWLKTGNDIGKMFWELFQLRKSQTRSSLLPHVLTPSSVRDVI